MNRFPVITTAVLAALVILMSGCESPANDLNETPLAGHFTATNLNQIAGSVTPVAITANPDGSPGAVVNIRYAGNTDLPQAAGSFAVTFDVLAAPGWNAATGLSARTLVVSEPEGEEEPGNGEKENGEKENGENDNGDGGYNGGNGNGNGNGQNGNGNGNGQQPGNGTEIRHPFTMSFADPDFPLRGDLTFYLVDKTGGKVYNQSILEKFRQVVYLQQAMFSNAIMRNQFYAVLSRGLEVIIEGPDVPAYDWFKIIDRATMSFHTSWILEQSTEMLRIFFEGAIRQHMFDMP